MLASMPRKSRPRRITSDLADIICRLIDYLRVPQGPMSNGDAVKVVSKLTDTSPSTVYRVLNGTELPEADEPERRNRETTWGEALILALEECITSLASENVDRSVDNIYERLAMYPECRFSRSTLYRVTAHCAVEMSKRGKKAGTAPCSERDLALWQFLFQYESYKTQGYKIVFFGERSVPLAMLDPNGTLAVASGSGEGGATAAEHHAVVACACTEGGVWGTPRVCADQNLNIESASKNFLESCLAVMERASGEAGAASGSRTRHVLVVDEAEHRVLCAPEQRVPTEETPEDEIRQWLYSHQLQTVPGTEVPLGNCNKQALLALARSLPVQHETKLDALAREYGWDVLIVPRRALLFNPARLFLAQICATWRVQTAKKVPASTHPPTKTPTESAISSKGKHVLGQRMQEAVRTARWRPSAACEFAASMRALWAERQTAEATKPSAQPKRARGGSSGSVSATKRRWSESGEQAEPTGARTAGSPANGRAAGVSPRVGNAVPHAPAVSSSSELRVAQAPPKRKAPEASTSGANPRNALALASEQRPCDALEARKRSRNVLKKPQDKTH